MSNSLVASAVFSALLVGVAPGAVSRAQAVSPVQWTYRKADCVRKGCAWKGGRTWLGPCAAETVIGVNPEGV